MKKLLFIMIALASFAAACGDSSGGSDSAAGYCTLSAQNDVADDFLDGEDFSPETMEAGFEKMQGLIDQAVKVAPSEIKDDFKVVAASFKQLTTGLKEADWNFLGLDPETLAILEDPELSAASDRIDAWDLANCS